MRLGAYPCILAPASLAAEAYGTTEISERHRHRYEFANDFREPLAAAGLVLSGMSPDKRLVEMVELNDHPFFIGCQFHPEFKSRPALPHPLFARFVRAPSNAKLRGSSRTRARCRGPRAPSTDAKQYALGTSAPNRTRAGSMARAKRTDAAHRRPAVDVKVAYEVEELVSRRLVGAKGRPARKSHRRR